MADRFGRLFEDQEQLDFGSWGVLSLVSALDRFIEAHDYFDQEAVRKQEDERFALVRAARRYYDGNHSKPLKVKEGQPDDNIILNLCRPLVDDGVSWLFGDPEHADRGMIEFDITSQQAEVESPAEGEPIEPADESVPATGPSRFSFLEMQQQEPTVDPRVEEASETLRQVYSKSGGFMLLKRLGIRGGVAGHFFLKIVPASDDEQSEFPRLVVLDPNLCSVRLDPTDQTRVTAYKIEWKRKVKPNPQSVRTVDMIYRQLVVELEGGLWAVADFTAKDVKKRRWEISNGPWAWPWKWSPIIDGPNIMPAWGYYGLSDLEDVAPLNDGLNFIVSNYARILKHHAHPKTVGTGFKAADVVASAIENFWTIDNPNAKVNNLEMESDLTSSMQLIELLRTEFWSQGRGLDPATYKDKIGQITNFGLRVLAVRALHKASDKRHTYGEALRQVGIRVLEMLGFEEGFDVIPQWPDPLPSDPKEALDMAKQEIDMELVSRRTVMEERGRSFELEMPRIIQEKKQRSELGQFLVEQFDKGDTPQPFGEGDGETEE